VNKQTKLLSAVLAVGSLLLLSGCAKYNAMPLQHLVKHADSSETSETKNITLEHKVFDKADCKTYLGKKNILKKGFQPVQLTVTNNSDRSYIYSTSSLSLSTVPAEVVAKKVHFSTGGRAVGIGLAAATVAIIAVTAIVGGGSCLGEAWFWQYIFPTALLSSSVPFAAGAIVAGTKDSRANAELEADFTAKAFPREGVLRPHQTINGIVFVAKNSFKEDFTFTVNDLKTDKAVVLSSL
jgi:hypothetical protein